MMYDLREMMFMQVYKSSYLGRRQMEILLWQGSEAVI